MRNFRIFTVDCLLQVTAIHRYLGDPKHDAQTGGIAGQSLDIIQLTLADSSHKIKVLLHYDLNKLVQRQEVNKHTLFYCSLETPKWIIARTL